MVLHGLSSLGGGGSVSSFDLFPGVEDDILNFEGRSGTAGESRTAKSSCGVPDQMLFSPRAERWLQNFVALGIQARGTGEEKDTDNSQGWKLEM